MDSFARQLPKRDSLTSLHNEPYTVNMEDIQRDRKSISNDSQGRIEGQPALKANDRDLEKGDPRELDPSGEPRPYPDGTLKPNTQYIAFGENDQEDPFQWSKSKKRIITFVSVAMTLVVSYCNSGYAVAQDGIMEAFGISRTVSILGITLFVLGFAITPLILAPLSEVYGRAPIYYSSFTIFTVVIIPIALAPNLAVMLVFRFIQGCAASTAATMVGGTLADMWHAEERGLYMSIYASTAFVGTALGPIVSGPVTFHLGWRYVFWVQLGFSGIVLILVFALLRETRGSVILSRRAEKIRKDTGNDRVRAPGDDERASIPILIKVSLTRPIHFLTKEPIVIAFTLWLSFVWSILYLSLIAIPRSLVLIYGFNIQQVGLGFIGLFVGSVVATLLNPIQEYLYRRAQEKNSGIPKPEARLYTSCVGTICFSGGIFMFGWTVYPSIHYVVPMTATAILIGGMFQIYLATFNYLADSYKKYAASALSAQGFVRNVLGAVFPLFSANIFETLGFQGGATLLGSIALLLSVIPFTLIYFGPKIRAKSKFAQESCQDPVPTAPKEAPNVPKAGSSPVRPPTDPNHRGSNGTSNGSSKGNDRKSNTT